MNHKFSTLLHLLKIMFFMCRSVDSIPNLPFRGVVCIGGVFACLYREGLELDCEQCRQDLQFLHSCVDGEQDYSSSLKQQQEMPTLSGNFKIVLLHLD